MWGKTLFTAVQMVLKNNVGKTLFNAKLYLPLVLKWYFQEQRGGITLFTAVQMVLKNNVGKTLFTSCSNGT